MMLFPAHAGVILGAGGNATVTETVPRTRGGDPTDTGDTREIEGCSPHTRG